MKPHHVFRFLNLFFTLVVPISSFSQECNIALPMNTCVGATCTYRYAYVAESIPVSFSSLPIVDTSAAFPGLCGPPPPVIGIGGIDGAIFSSLWVAITDSQVTNQDMSPYNTNAGSEQKFLVTIPPETKGLVGASSIRSVSAISGAPTAHMTLSGTSSLRFVDALGTPLRYVRWATSRADACLLAVANDPRTSIDVSGTVTTFNNASPVGLCSNAVLSQPVESVCRPDLPYTPGVARFDVPPAASGECFNPCATGATSLIGTYYAPLNQYLLSHNQSATFYPASAPNCAAAGVIRTCNGQASMNGAANLAAISNTLGSLSGPGTHTRPIGSCTSTCAAGTTLNWSQNGNNCSYTTATQGDLGDSNVVNDGGGSYIGSATLSCNAGGWAVTGGTCAPAGSDCWRALCGGFSNMYFSPGSFVDGADCEAQGIADYCVGGPVSCTYRINDIACNGSTLCSPGSTTTTGCPIIANGDSRKTCAANGASWSACSSSCDAGYTSSGVQPGIACNNASDCNFSSSSTCVVGGGCDAAAWNAFIFRVTGELQARGILDPATTYNAQYSSMGTKYNNDSVGTNTGMSLGTTTNYTLGSNSVGLRVSWLGKETNLPGSFDVTVDGSVVGACQATPGFCPPLSITWGGGSCRAIFPSTANNTQSTAQTNTAAGYTGSAMFRCNQGFWEVTNPVAGATCAASACGWQWESTGGGIGNVPNSSNLCTGPAGGYGDATPEATAVCNATTNNGTNITCGDTGAAWNSYRCRNTCPALLGCLAIGSGCNNNPQAGVFTWGAASTGAAALSNACHVNGYSISSNATNCGSAAFLIPFPTAEGESVVVSDSQAPQTGSVTLTCSGSTTTTYGTVSMSGASCAGAVTCGATHGTTWALQSAPNSGLCSDGSTPTVTSNAGSWTWTCGSNNCSAAWAGTWVRLPTGNTITPFASQPQCTSRLGGNHPGDFTPCHSINIPSYPSECRNDALTMSYVCVPTPVQPKWRVMPNNVGIICNVGGWGFPDSNCSTTWNAIHSWQACHNGNGYHTYCY